ncbi:MAG: hypothetical protein KDD69_04050 [Bdellovibrionales bacterium]|nr:hypothetical protein [Bdellovibrionales bacterium]
MSILERFSSTEFFSDGLAPKLDLSAAERALKAVLVVEPDSAVAVSLRASIRNLGFGSCYVANDHVAALKYCREHPVTDVLFSVAETTLAADAFVSHLIGDFHGVVPIALSNRSEVPLVLPLFRLGLRAYVGKPFTEETLEHALIAANLLDPIPQTVLTAENRNTAFAAMILGDLDRFLLCYRQAKEFETARAELARRRAKLLYGVEVAHALCEGSADDLTQALVDSAIELAEKGTSRLGRLRRQLLETRQGRREAE